YHAGGLPRLDRRTGVVVLSRAGKIVGSSAHRLDLTSRSLSPHDAKQLRGARVVPATETLQRWICESCGYIYDPDEGDPDGGIPPGTDFEDIPDTWFCPVCGARKRDFTRNED